MKTIKCKAFPDRAPINGGTNTELQADDGAWAAPGPTLDAKIFGLQLGWRGWSNVCHCFLVDIKDSKYDETGLMRESAPWNICIGLLNRKFGMAKSNFIGPEN